jgi:glyoxylase-like metal-dependent hydrolase (beta-lactamase superfamily II)
MQQLVPGIFHWTAVNPSIGARVSSYYVEAAAAVIDPMVPEEGLDSLPGRPERVLLSSGHHLRDSRRIADALGIPIYASRQAVEHLGAEGRSIEPWGTDGAHPAPGITALHVGVLCDDEGALFIDVDDGALVLADAVHHGRDGLAFFSDSLLGEDPGSVKQGLKAALGALAESLEFDALLLAHGEPLATGGRAALRAFAERQ